MNNRCCICGCHVGLGYDTLCKKHWAEYKHQLNEPWLRFLISEEHKERRYRRRTKNYLSLDELAGNL